MNRALDFIDALIAAGSGTLGLVIGYFIWHG